MMRLIKKYWKVLAIFVVPFLMFYPSLFGFYTNDDFFFLKIANVSSFKDFLNFFNLVKDIGGIGVYRPLTLRVFYFLTDKLFHLNTLPLHLISFISFFLIIFLVGVLVRLLTKNNKIALLSAFLYGVSATHFGQLYYIGAFQELCLTLLFLVSVILFTKYEIEIKGKHSLRKLVISLLFFVMSLMSKETAVVLPFVLVLIHIYLTLTKQIKVPVRTLVLSLFPYIFILGFYLFLHFRYFGLVSGDSYVWNFAPSRALNTLGWYALWTLNLPEMLVDFIGPGLHLNPNLLKYWSNEIIPIFILFALQILIILVSLFKFISADRSVNKKRWLLIVFSLFWFIATLVPVLFLPVHKFTYYLTLPLIGIVLILGYLLDKAEVGKIVIGLFLGVWTIASLLTLHLTFQTNWITQGAKISEKVYLYFSQNTASKTAKNIVFVDTSEDKSLPWSPTQTLKTVLSDKSFFDVFYPKLSEKINYSGLENIPTASGTEVIKSRHFLGY